MKLCLHTKQSIQLLLWVAMIKLTAAVVGVEVVVEVVVVEKQFPAILRLWLQKTVNTTALVKSNDKINRN